MIATAGRTLTIIFVLLAWVTFSFAESYTVKPQWNEYKSDHFVIYYHPGIPNKYIREFTRRCEAYYYLIAERLGLRRFDYWSWENRAKVFVYESRQQYIKDTGRPGWSAASVHKKKKFISTYYFEEDFFDSILPHELTHIVLREFIGFDVKVPLWFEEGVACANEDNCYLKYLLVAKGFFDKQAYLAVAEMERIESSTPQLSTLFYPTAASVVIFLLENYKKSSFLELCRQLRDGEAFYEAMNRVYGIKDAEDLNERYLRFMESKRYEDIAAGQNPSVKW